MKFFALTFLFLLGCQDLNSNSSDASLYGGGEAINEGNIYFDQAYETIKDRCANCHYHNEWAALKRNSDWLDVSAVEPGDHTQSTLITKLKNYTPPGNMPLDAGAIPTAEYDNLIDWVDSL